LIARAAALLAAASQPLFADPPEFTVDFARPVGRWKALHGVNNGPYDYGEHAKLDGFHAEAGFPSTRLHDVHWPHPDAVDIHCVFPRFDADADDPGNYTFAKTDDYVAAIVRNKSQIVYRLGESIEPWTRYHNHPPKDAQKWAKICVNIIRHYNEGWANGFHHGIKYWEIWNEPEAGFMWTGTREQYFALYETAARAIKAHDPALKVGGPAHNNINSEWVRPFLAFCREKSLPLDFFSWHAYYGRPSSLAEDATTARRFLDEFGFKNTESHLNEWRYLTTWDGLRPGNAKDYVNVPGWFERSCQAEGAAFCATVLMTLQDRSVDMMNFYSADASAWSMFGQFGIPTKVFYAFKAFNQLAALSNRIAIEGPPPRDITLGAALTDDRKRGAILAVNFKAEPGHLNLKLHNFPWPAGARADFLLIDSNHDWTRTGGESLSGSQATLSVPLPANALCLVQFTSP
jgi:hypothetical protein